MWILATLPLLGWWATGLFDLDEGFYAAVVAEMNRRGEWITPYYNGHPWFEKPILLYWLAKPVVAAFGLWIGPRLISVLAMLGLYALVDRFLRNRGEAQAGQWSVVVLSTSLLCIALGRLMMTDAVLGLALSLAFLSFFDSLDNPRRRWLTGLGLGLAVLAKGPFGLIVFAIVAGIAYWKMPDQRGGYRGGWLTAGGVFFVTIASWYLPCYLANRSLFVDEFIIHQNIQRFLGGDAAHAVPFPLGLIYYPVVVGVLAAPWSWRLPKLWRSRNQDALDRYAWIWFGTLLVLFTLSGAKLPHYILPAMTPLAILVARGASRTQTDPVRWHVPLAVGSCVLVNGLLFWWYGSPQGGAHAELHRLALPLRSAQASVVTYQITRQDADLGTGKLKIQETSHPSLAFYLDRPVPDLSRPEELLKLPPGSWIITRSDRIIPAETPIDLRDSGLYYRVYRVR